MKEIYLLSYMMFRKEEGNVVTYAYAFKSEEEAIKFRNTLLDEVNCATLTVHEVYETCEDALVRMVESVKCMNQYP